jgi:hypothetical protein
MTTRELLNQVEYALAAEVITLDDEVILVGAGNRKSSYITNIVVPALIMNRENMIPSWDELGRSYLGFTDTPELPLHKENFI